MATVSKFAITPSGYQGDDLMTAQEVADWLKVKPSWVAEQVKERVQIRSKNPLPHIRLGKYTRFSRMRIAEWLAEHST